MSKAHTAYYEAVQKVNREMMALSLLLILFQTPRHLSTFTIMVVANPMKAMSTEAPIVTPI